MSEGDESGTDKIEALKARGYSVVDISQHDGGDTAWSFVTPSGHIADDCWPTPLAAWIDAAAHAREAA